MSKLRLEHKFGQVEIDWFQWGCYKQQKVEMRLSIDPSWEYPGPVLAAGSDIQSSEV